MKIWTDEIGPIMTLTMGLNTRKAAANSSAPKHARQRLLHAARVLLSKGGVEAATARAICHRAEVRAPSLYHHFGDLRRLHGAAINAAFAEVMAEYRREAQTGGTIAAVRQAWQVLMHFARTEPRLARLFISRAVDGEAPEALRLTLRRLQRDLADLGRRQGLAVEAGTALSVLWMAAVGAVSVSTQEGEAAVDATETLLEGALTAITTNGVSHTG